MFQNTNTRNVRGRKDNPGSLCDNVFCRLTESVLVKFSIKNKVSEFLCHWVYLSGWVVKLVGFPMEECVVRRVTVGYTNSKLETLYVGTVLTWVCRTIKFEERKQSDYQSSLYLWSCKLRMNSVILCLFHCWFVVGSMKKSSCIRLVDGSRSASTIACSLV